LANPNSIYNEENLALFIDSLITYGGGYINRIQVYRVFRHRERRLHALSEICFAIKMTDNSVKEIEMLWSNQEELLKIILESLKVVHHFLTSLKQIVTELEIQNNIGVDQLGHLVPLTVGHRDKPTEKEVKYIKKVI
jgi:hypothetical protein